MNKKVIQMVRYLQRDGAWVRGERLSAQFGVSTRQIRNYVSAANTSGCLISSSEKGYRLLDMNPSFRMLLDAEDNPESRLKRLLLVLLFSSEPDDIFTFSEQFYVSVPTMEADLQKLRRVLIEELACVGRVGLLRRADNELDIQFSLQCGDMRADGRLRQVQQLRGAGKAAVFHHVDERFELFDIHINVHEVPPSDRQKRNVLR